MTACLACGKMGWGANMRVVADCQMCSRDKGCWPFDHDDNAKCILMSSWGLEERWKDCVLSVHAVLCLSLFSCQPRLSIWMGLGLNDAASHSTYARHNQPPTHLGIEHAPLHN
jgi:hypothetical protein